MKRLIILGAAVLLVIIFLILKNGNGEKQWITGTVDEGDIARIISVSGTMDAIQAAKLAFPITGVLAEVFVTEGSAVSAGETLASLAHNDLKADYQDALGALLVARSDRDELVAGLRPEERAVAETNVEIARQDLERVKKEHAERVENARRALLSTDLEAMPDKKDRDYVAPVISGTYSCEAEGTYILDVYASKAQSGFSYTVSGFESGTFTVYTEAPGMLANCGLFIQFTEDESYANSRWTIEVPNKQSSLYITNLNAFDLARIQQENAITAAEEALRLAEQNLTLDVAAPRSERLARAEAQVRQAEARLNRVSAQIEDHVLTAPFDGTVTKVDLVPGETVSSDPVVTVISDAAFELTALIPEIDITKISVGQKASVVFDARAEEPLGARVVFISPLAEEIGGVSYFEAKLMLDSNPDWLRSGLNADIDIVIERHQNVLRVPRRFVLEEDGQYYVFLPRQNKKTAQVPVEVEFIGNDGFVQISGLKRGDTVVAP